jgi:hypothetical protein
LTTPTFRGMLMLGDGDRQGIMGCPAPALPTDALVGVLGSGSGGLAMEQRAGRCG